MEQQTRQRFAGTATSVKLKWAKGGGEYWGIVMVGDHGGRATKFWFSRSALQMEQSPITKGEQLEFVARLDGASADGQINWLREVQFDGEPDPTVPLPTLTLSFDGIANLLHTAQEHLKWPKIRLQTADGYQFTIHLAGAMSKEPGSAILSGVGWHGDYLGRVSKDGTFRGHAPEPVLKVLRALADNPERVAAEYGLLTGQCCFCGRGLEDERSTTVGYGPTCARHYGLTWGKKEVAA